jgi:hypothetical protein
VSSILILPSKLYVGTHDVIMQYCDIMYRRQHVRLYKTVKFSKLIFNHKHLDIENRFDWEFLTGLIWHTVVRTGGCRSTLYAMFMVVLHSAQMGNRT